MQQYVKEILDTVSHGISNMPNVLCIDLCNLSTSPKHQDMNDSNEDSVQQL